VFGGVSATWLQQWASDISSYYSGKSQQTWSKFSKIITWKDKKDIHELKAAIDNANWKINDTVVDKFKASLKWKDLDKLKSEPDFRKELFRFMKDILHFSKEDLAKLWIKNADSLNDVNVLAKALKKIDYEFDTKYWWRWYNLFDTFSKDKNFLNITESEKDRINRELNPLSTTTTTTTNNNNTSQQTTQNIQQVFNNKFDLLWKLDKKWDSVDVSSSAQKIEWIVSKDSDFSQYTSKQFIDELSSKLRRFYWENELQQSDAILIAAEIAKKYEDKFRK